MGTVEFLEILAKQGLLPPDQVEKLRRQVLKAAKPVLPDALATTLVKQGLLTEFQANQALRAIETSAPSAPPTARRPPHASLPPVSRLPQGSR